MTRFSTTLLFACTLFTSVTVFSQPFSLLKDINYGNPTTCQGARNAQNLTGVNGTLFFTLNATSIGGLWKSDGTEVGTVRVKEIVGITKMIAIGNTLFFLAEETFGSSVLWKSDGTEAGTVAVKLFNVGTNLTDVNGTLFLSDNAGLWKSDGTEAGTVLVKAFGSSLANVTNVNGVLFFSTVIFPPFRATLWKSDGTEAGTVLVKDGYPRSGSFVFSNFFNANGTLYYVGDDGVNGAELWKSDGTDAGTVMVKDINPGFESSGVRNFALLNGSTYFFASTSNQPTPAIWKTDGTEAGTTKVKDIQGSGLIAVNGSLFFTGVDNGDNSELWKSDGTDAGTVMVKDIFPGTDGSYPTGLTNVSGILYFVAVNELVPPGTPVTCSDTWGELWKSDGTEAGTVMVRDIYRGAGVSNPTRLQEVNGVLYFVANNGINGPELWKSNGTAIGTSMVKDIIFPTGSSNPRYFTASGGQVYFSAFDQHSGPAFVRGEELHRTDGTLSGTYQVGEIFGLGSGFPSELTDLNGVLLLSANNGSHGLELFRSDGISTVMLKDINPFLGVGRDRGSNPTFLTRVNSQVFFSANDDVNGYELWKSDGTELGTVMVKDINPTAGNSNPANLVNVNGTLYFTADNGTDGIELWKSDGTEAGTLMIKNINAGSNSSSPGSLIAINGVLFFTANDGINGTELWKSDGTEAGTVMIKNINETGSASPASLANISGVLYFSADDGVNGAEVWKSDGTETGTVLLKDIHTGPIGSSPASFANINGRVYFSADDGIAGRELWGSNGSETGTLLIKDIQVGSASSNPSLFTRVGNNLLFRADDGLRGAEIWLTNGAEAGTRLMFDLEPGVNGSNPTEIFPLGARVLAAATNSTFGTEVYIADAPAEIPLPLELLEFTGAVVNSDGLLKWKTENENNTSSFIIERSLDGQQYSSTASVTAANTPGVHHYDFTDVNIASLGVNAIYYRLKQVDIDGRYTYSNIVVLSINNHKPIVMVYPNPTREDLNLTITIGQNEKLNWRLVDHAGRVVKNGHYNLTAGSTAVKIDTRHLSAGIYMMQLQGTTVQQVIKVIKQ